MTTKKPRRGRPPKDKADVLGGWAHVRLSTTQARLLEDAADVEDLAISEFIRRAALAAAEKTLSDGRKKK